MFTTSFKLVRNATLAATVLALGGLTGAPAFAQAPAQPAPQKAPAPPPGPAKVAPTTPKLPAAKVNCPQAIGQAVKALDAPGKTDKTANFMPKYQAVCSKTKNDTVNAMMEILKDPVIVKEIRD